MRRITTTTTKTWSNPTNTHSSHGSVFKPKKSGTKTSHVVFILDESSSMMSVREQTIQGYNEFLDSNRDNAKKNNIETFVSLYKFNGYDVNRVMYHQNIQEVEPITNSTYNPSGMTNLVDAIGGVMCDVNKTLAETKKKHRDSVVICVLTDGMENASKTFKNSDIAQMVKKAEKAGWSFTFIGADIDAFGVSGSLGFRQDNTLQFDKKNVGETFRSAARYSNDMKNLVASGYDSAEASSMAAYTVEERTKVVSNE